MLIGVLAALLSGCSQHPPAPQRITADLNGKAVTLKPEQELVVLLKANPTTGYAWAIAEVNDAVLQQTGMGGYTPEPATQRIVGAGGLAEFHFRAVAPGTTMLRLVYRRPWETSAPPVQAFTLKVDVQP